MKLYVVRHCRTEYNTRRVYCGRTDIPLSEEGLREAEDLARRVRGLEFDLILTSPLTRARQTAQALARGRDIPVTPDVRLLEIDFGAMEGRSITLPEAEPPRVNFAVRWPGGESSLDAAARVYPLLRELPERVPGKNILLVTHGGLCRVIRSYFADLTDAEFHAFAQHNGVIEEYEL